MADDAKVEQRHRVAVRRIKSFDPDDFEERVLHLLANTERDAEERGRREEREHLFALTTAISRLHVTWNDHRPEGTERLFGILIAEAQKATTAAAIRARTAKAEVPAAEPGKHGICTMVNGRCVVCGDFE